MVSVQCESILLNESAELGCCGTGDTMHSSSPNSATNLEVPRPEPAVADDNKNRYVFERPVTFRHPTGLSSTGFIDLYKRGCFVLGSQTGSEAPEPSLLFELPHRRGTAVRGTAGWDQAMLRARNQAEAVCQSAPRRRWLAALPHRGRRRLLHRALRRLFRHREGLTSLSPIPSITVSGSNSSNPSSSATASAPSGSTRSHSTPVAFRPGLPWTSPGTWQTLPDPSNRIIPPRS